MEGIVLSFVRHGAKGLQIPHIGPVGGICPCTCMLLATARTSSISPHVYIFIEKLDVHSRNHIQEVAHICAHIYVHMHAA